MFGCKLVSIVGIYLLLLLIVGAQNYDQDSSALISGEKSPEQHSTTSKPSDYQSGSKEIAKEDYNKEEASYEQKSRVQSAEVDRVSGSQEKTSTTIKASKSSSSSSSSELNSADWSKSSESTTVPSTIHSTKSQSKYATSTSKPLVQQHPAVTSKIGGQQTPENRPKHPYLTKTSLKPISNSKSQATPDESYGTAPKIIPSFAKKVGPLNRPIQKSSTFPQKPSNLPPRQNRPYGQRKALPQQNVQQRHGDQSSNLPKNHQYQAKKAQTVTPSGYSQNQNMKIQTSSSAYQKPKNQQLQTRPQQSRKPLTNYQQRPSNLMSNVNGQNKSPQKYSWASMSGKQAQKSQNYNWATISQKRPIQSSQMGHSNQKLGQQSYKQSPNQPENNVQKARYQGTVQIKRPITANPTYQQANSGPQQKPSMYQANNGMQKWQPPRKSNYQVVQKGYGSNRQQPKISQSATKSSYTSNSATTLMAMNQLYQPRRNNGQYQRPIPNNPNFAQRRQNLSKKPYYTPFQQNNFKSTTYKPRGQNYGSTYTPFQQNNFKSTTYRPRGQVYNGQKSNYTGSTTYNPSPISQNPNNRPISQNSQNYRPAPKSYNSYRPLYNRQSYRQSPQQYNNQHSIQNSHRTQNALMSNYRPISQNRRPVQNHHSYSTQNPFYYNQQAQMQSYRQRPSYHSNLPQNNQYRPRIQTYQRPVESYNYRPPVNSWTPPTPSNSLSTQRSTGYERPRNFYSTQNSQNQSPYMRFRFF